MALSSTWSRLKLSLRLRLRLRTRPLLARGSLEEAGALRQDQPVQHISLLLSVCSHRDLDVAGVRKERKLVLWEVGGAAMVGPVAAVSSSGGGRTARRDRGRAADESAIWILLVRQRRGQIVCGCSCCHGESCTGIVRASAAVWSCMLTLWSGWGLRAQRNVQSTSHGKKQDDLDAQVRDNFVNAKEQNVKQRGLVLCKGRPSIAQGDLQSTAGQQLTRNLEVARYRYWACSPCKRNAPEDFKHPVRGRSAE